MSLAINVDARSALARFSPAGIPQQVRANLRAAIPPLMRDLSAAIDSNLGALKSRTNLQLKGGPQGQMIENATQVIGRAEMMWTGDPAASMVPAVLEGPPKHGGTYPIVPINAKALYFYWPKVSSFVALKKVNHPYFKGIAYMAAAFDSMRSQIVMTLENAVNEGVKK